MPIPGKLPGDPLKYFIKKYYNTHTHDVTGVTAGTDTVTSAAPKKTAK